MDDIYREARPVKLNSQIACHHCDLLFLTPEDIAPKQFVCCPRCHTEQFESRKDPLDKTIAITLSAMMLLIVSVSFPFLSIEANGAENTITLLATPFALFEQGYYFIGIIVLCGVVVMPALYMLCTLALLLPLYLVGHDWLAPVFAKAISAMRPWVMVDVFVVSVLVSLVKIVKDANVILGLAFWSYIVFSILFILVTIIASKRQVWYWVAHGHE